jgi:anaerobic magnesium-protoporphyrin IX monomethyl ester cyclase
MLRESGCYSLALGLESGDDTVLRNMNKKSTAEENYDAVCNANHAGIDVYATFVVGFPGETEKTFENTVDMVKRFPSGNGAFNFYRAFPFLLTPLCPAAAGDFRKAHNLTGGQNWWEHPTMNFKQAADMVREMFLAVDNAFYRYLNSTEATALRNDIPQHRTILETRQRLAQGRIGGREEVDEPTLWDTMARAYQELDQGI